MRFHEDLQKLSVILQKNLFSENLVNNCISRYTQTAVTVVKFTSAYLFQLAQEKSCDYLLIMHMKKV